jgi:ligand-binding sensor domain-containing protein
MYLLAMNWFRTGWTCILLLAGMGVFGQVIQPHFRLVGVQQGLNDGYVSEIVQDKYGYIWIGTLGGLNRFNGRKVQRYVHVYADSTSAPTGNPYSMLSDDDGRLWIGYDYGLFEYDHQTGHFVRHRLFDNTYIKRMAPGPNHIIYLLTSKGFFAYNTQSRQRTEPGKTDTVIANHPVMSLKMAGNVLLLGSANGYIHHNVQTGKSHFVAVPASKPYVAVRIGADSAGGVWLSDILSLVLVRHQADGGITTEVSEHPAFKAVVPAVVCNGFACDDSGNVWISTPSNGPIRYNLRTRTPEFIYQALDANGRQAAKFAFSIMKSSDGNLWLAGQNGAYYFKPEQKLFSTFLPFPESYNANMGRAMLQDKSGNLWFTGNQGTSRYNSKSATYTVWSNEPGKPERIYYNSVRGIAEDNEGTIWIATGKGVNSCRPGQNTLRFHDESEGIPRGFYFSANSDSKGRVWMGTRDNDGLYYYTTADHRFRSVREHPLLKKMTGYGVRITFEDSKGRLWFGYNGAGLAMADEKTGELRYWFNDDKTRNTIIGNMIVDIKEDRKGVIWVSSFNGVTGINIKNNTYRWLGDSVFYSTSYTGPLLVDAKDRLWIGTANGLYVADTNRKICGSFFESDGLPANGFSEHSGYTLANGMAMMPGLYGFAMFDPLRYEPAPASYGFYVAGMEVAGHMRQIPRLSRSSVVLSPYENNFSIELEDISYNTTTPIQFAFKLEGFDKDWRLTTDPKIVYTNVPGGKYNFRYRISGFAGIESTEEKIMEISIGTVYYKTMWFSTLVGLVVAGLIFAWVRYRMAHQRQLLQLQATAQQLEKEKVMVMYENLKQHLNPHFLFNSLTSLSSLIRVNQDLAGHFLDRMSKIYRYILKNRDSETVSLKDELEFVAQYIELQKTRFEEGLQVRMKIDEDDLDKRLAPVTLQNLVENAIKHNTTSKSKPLVIEIFTSDNYLVVRNNLQQKNFVETSNKTGLQSMRSLYAYLSPLPLLAENANGCFTVKIPLL